MQASQATQRLRVTNTPLDRPNRSFSRSLFECTPGCACSISARQDLGVDELLLLGEVRVSEKGCRACRGRRWWSGASGDVGNLLRLSSDHSPAVAAAPRDVSDLLEPSEGARAPRVVSEGKPLSESRHFTPATGV
jgi:hypothetical protein